MLKVLGIIIAVCGLLLLIIPQKIVKKSLAEKKNGLLIGRLYGIVLILCGVVLLFLKSVKLGL